MRTWGNVEVAMSETIRKLLDTDMTTSQIVIRALDNMHTQRELAAELGKHRLGNADMKTLEGLLDRVKANSTRRNRIVHGKWMLSLEMGTIPNPKPLTAKSAKWLRIYMPSQQGDIQTLMSGKSQKLDSAYKFWPEQIAQYANAASALAKEVERFSKFVALKPPRIPLPVDW